MSLRVPIRRYVRGLRESLTVALCHSQKSSNNNNDNAKAGDWRQPMLQHRTIGVRDQFRLGGLRSVARIFSPLLARKSSGFARILPDFLPEYGYFENSRGGGCSPPPPRLVRLCIEPIAWQTKFNSKRSITSLAVYSALTNSIRSTLIVWAHIHETTSTLCVVDFKKPCILRAL